MARRWRSGCLLLRRSVDCSFCAVADTPFLAGAAGLQGRLSEQRPAQSAATVFRAESETFFYHLDWGAGVDHADVFDPAVFPWPPIYDFV